MNENNDFDIEKNTEELFKGLIKFQTDSQKGREVTRDKYRKEEPKLHNDFRITIDGLLGRMSNQLLQTFDNPTEKKSYQLSLVASFLRTHFLINDLIINGDLIEAVTLVRKQLEMLTRMHEIDEKPILKLLKKTPNVMNIFGPAGKNIYPTLSEIAHFATPRVGDLIKFHSKTDNRSGPGLVPFYNEDAINYYNQHAYVSIYFCFWFIEFLKTIYKEKYNATYDNKTFLILIRMAEDCDIITLDANIKNKNNA
jgi:hypothetical protein